MKRKIKFHKKTSIDNDFGEKVELIVIDEVSMVSEKILNDLKSFNIKILALGDKGQLQPPMGRSNLLLKNPDVMLNEIVRQAKDNPIIHLSMLARQGKRISYGRYGDDVWVIRKNQINEKMTTKADQILCGYNKTRRKLNSEIREIYGFKSTLPSKDDKLICTRNDWTKSSLSLPLINGMIGYCQSEIRSVNYEAKTFRMDFLPEQNLKHRENGTFDNLKVDMTEFLKYENSQVTEPRNKGQYGEKQYFDYGYAITVHKSQGSQWEKILLINENFGKQHNKWLYTGITRSSKKLILAF